MNEFFFNNNKEITRKIEKYNTFVSIDCILGNYPLLKCKQKKIITLLFGAAMTIQAYRKTPALLDLSARRSINLAWALVGQEILAAPHL